MCGLQLEMTDSPVVTPANQIDVLHGQEHGVHIVGIAGRGAAHWCHGNAVATRAAHDRHGGLGGAALAPLASLLRLALGLADSDIDLFSHSTAQHSKQAAWSVEATPSQAHTHTTHLAQGNSSKVQHAEHHDQDDHGGDKVALLCVVLALKAALQRGTKQTPQ